MSYKTDRLVDLFPRAYAAGERESVLYKVLDAIGAELMTADDKVKRLLKSHWVRYAEGSALDGLGAIYGVSRRTLRSGQTESDESFRTRLQSTVRLFTGGGTVHAIKGAVRSALGLPFSLDQLGLPTQFDALRDDIDRLVDVQEFSPKGDRVLEGSVTAVPVSPRANASEVVVSVNATTVAESLPRIEWTFERGTARRLEVVRLDSGEGFRSIDDFIVPVGKTVVFTADTNNRLSAVIDGIERASAFTKLDSSVPALLPPVPVVASQWRFRAQSGLWDLAAFDGDAFDVPQFHVAITRQVFEPLTFEVEVPFFLQDAVAELKRRHGYPGEIFVFEGIPLDRLQEVVDLTRAAGVRGSVRFALRFFETHDEGETTRGDLSMALVEDANAADTLTAANTSELVEAHEVREQLTLAGMFDISRFDGPFGFV